MAQQHDLADFKLVWKCERTQQDDAQVFRINSNCNFPTFIASTATVGKR